MAEKNTKTRSYGMAEKCAECQNYWLDGHKDCQITVCGLYPWMPYRKLEPDWGWSGYSPKRTGRVTWEESRMDLTAEQEAELKERGCRLAASRREARAENEYLDVMGVPTEGSQPQVPTLPDVYAETAGPEDTGAINPEDYDNDPIWG